MAELGEELRRALPLTQVLARLRRCCSAMTCLVASAMSSWLFAAVRAPSALRFCSCPGHWQLLPCLARQPFNRSGLPKPTHLLHINARGNRRMFVRARLHAALRIGQRRQLAAKAQVARHWPLEPRRHARQRLRWPCKMGAEDGSQTSPGLQGMVQCELAEGLPP